jgi:hypothetical protein
LPNQEKRKGQVVLDRLCLKRIADLANSAGLEVKRVTRTYRYEYLYENAITSKTESRRAVTINGHECFVSRPTCVEFGVNNARIAAGSMLKQIRRYKYFLFFIDVEVRGIKYEEIFIVPSKEITDSKAGPRIRIPLTADSVGSPALNWESFRGKTGMEQLKENVAR